MARPRLTPGPGTPRFRARHAASTPASTPAIGAFVGLAGRNSVRQ